MSESTKFTVAKDGEALLAFLRNMPHQAVLMAMALVCFYYYGKTTGTESSYFFIIGAAGCTIAAFLSIILSSVVLFRVVGVPASHKGKTPWLRVSVGSLAAVFALVLPIFTFTIALPNALGIIHTLNPNSEK